MNNVFVYKKMLFLDILCYNAMKIYLRECHGYKCRNNKIDNAYNGQIGK